MGQPSEPPRKKIRRTRTGCFTCRRRRIKCDERKPFCKACTRLGLDCEGYRPRHRFAAFGELAAPIQQNVQILPKHQANELPAYLDPFRLQAFGSDMVGGEPQTSVPVVGAGYISVKEGSDDEDSTIPSRDDLPIIFDEGARYPQETIPTFEQPETQTQHFLRSQKGGSSHIEDIYLKKWRTCVVACLPPIFRDVTIDMPDFPPLRSAMLAISASYLAHIESSTVTTNAGGRRSRYVPQSEHRCRSLEFYDRGVRELTKLVSASNLADINYVLATSLLLHCFEIDSGSVVGAGGHMESIDNIVMSAYNELNGNLIGQKLLCTWMVLRGVVVSRRLSIGLGLARLPPFISSNDLDYMMSKAATPYDSIMRLLYTSLSLIRVVILDMCVCRGTSLVTPEKKHTVFAGVLDQVCLPQSRDCSISELAAIDEGYCKSLEQQSAKLDEWHSRLHVSELPIDSFTSQRAAATVEEATSEPHIAPLRFQTHEAAMNYLYYSLAQMLGSRRAVEQLITMNDPPIEFTNCNYPWEHLILRITAGLNLADCVTKHTFRFGITSILSTCAAWCPHVSVANAAERWVSKLEACGLAVEDGVPIAIIKRELSFVVESKKKDQDMLRIAVLASAETESGELYQSDFRMLSAVCAKDRRTGRLYNDICEIP